MVVSGGEFELEGFFEDNLDVIHDVASVFDDECAVLSLLAKLWRIEIDTSFNTGGQKSSCTSMIAKAASSLSRGMAMGAGLANNQEGVACSGWAARYWVRVMTAALNSSWCFRASLSCWISLSGRGAIVVSCLL